MKGWRTLAFQGLTIGVAWLNAKFAFIALSTEESAAVVLTVLAIVNGVLRMMTSTAVGQGDATT